MSWPTPQNSPNIESIRQLLLEWRESKALEAGLTPEHPLYCARHSIILHDIFVDAISQNATRINSVHDLRNYAYYWKWIDNYGDDLFETVRIHLNSPKRCTTFGDDSQDTYQHSPKRVRTSA